ncbi:hypothetical protein D3C73_657430 [compost metagenome]
MNIKPMIIYMINCIMEDEEEDFPVFRFLNVIGFLLSKVTLVSKIILNCVKFTPKFSHNPLNRRINRKIYLSILLNSSDDVRCIQCIVVGIG